MIQFECQQCGKELNVHDDAAGSQKSCLYCGAGVTVPDGKRVGGQPSEQQTLFADTEPADVQPQQQPDTKTISGPDDCRRRAKKREEAAGKVAIAMGGVWVPIMSIAILWMAGRLWSALGWPIWILVGAFVVAVIMKSATPAILVLLVAFIAGFFRGAWQKSLALLGVCVALFAGLLLMSLIWHVLMRSKHPELVPRIGNLIGKRRTDRS